VPASPAGATARPVPEPAFAGRPASPQQPAPQPVRQPRPVAFDDDELDIPDFLK
jgi:cell division protein FtsZ